MTELAIINEVPVVDDLMRPPSGPVGRGLNDPQEAISVVVADDSSLFRDLLIRVLRGEGVAVIGESQDLPGTLAAVQRLRPSVAILDIRMPPTFTNEGIVAAKALQAGATGVGVLLLSQEVETSTAKELLESCAGGIGYLLKDRVASFPELLTAVRRVAHGEVVLDPEVVRKLFGRRFPDDPLDRLTGAQLAVLKLVAEGRSNRGIAEQRCMSERTVETHVTAIFDQLGLVRTPDVHRRVLAAMRFLRQRSE